MVCNNCCEKCNKKENKYTREEISFDILKLKDYSSYPPFSRAVDEILEKIKNME